MELDRKDIKILDELQKDSRQTIKELSRKTKYRPSTIHSRIKKLIENGVIQRFSIRLNNEILGNNFVVFVLVNTNSKIPEVFFKEKSVKEVFGITGEYDLIIKCRFKGIDDMNKFILKLRDLEQVQKTITMIGTLKLKEEL